MAGLIDEFAESIDPDYFSDTSETFINSMFSVAHKTAGDQALALSKASEDAIVRSSLTGPQAIAFEDAVLNASSKTGVHRYDQSDPDALLGKRRDDAITVKLTTSHV